jgi:hypothetical protein
MTVLFGGDACPLGLSVQFLDAPEQRVVDALPGPLVSTSTGAGLPAALDALLPFQAPWTQMLTAQVGAWTALLNNFIGGGDSTAPGPAIARSLGARCVVAEHAPRYGSGHAAIQLEVIGPDGEPPLMIVRALSATATDGRWEWHESGTPFPFERTERYLARLTRDRFDRPLLLEYLSALDIPVEDEAYREVTMHQQQVTWESREVTLGEAIADFAAEA